MKRFPIAVAVAAFALVSATGAFATEPLKIDGTVIQNVTAERNTNYASGNESVARQAFGVVDADVGESGYVEQNVNAYDNTNTADGTGAEACQVAGAIGSLDELCDSK